MKTFLLLCSLVVGSSLGEILSAKGMRMVGDALQPRKLSQLQGNAVLRWDGLS